MIAPLPESAGGGVDEGALDALARLVAAGAKPRAAAAVVAELTGRERERALSGVRRLKSLLVVALLALALPAAAAARKSAWQQSSLSGTYAYHAANTHPAACADGRDGVVLSRDYTETWHADSFRRKDLAAKYFPVFTGPETNGPGQKAHLVRDATLTETYRTFTRGSDDQGNDTCTSQDQACSRRLTGTQSSVVLVVTHSGSLGGPLRIQWNIGFPDIPDCTPATASDLRRGLLPENEVPHVFKSKATKRQFARRRSSFSFRGGEILGGTNGLSANITITARATLKKLTVADGCVDRRPQSLFVCTN